METYSNYRINPMIQTHSLDTIRHCTDSLTYISITLAGLIQADKYPEAYRGLRGLIDCIELALEYEFYRLHSPTVPVQPDAKPEQEPVDQPVTSEKDEPDSTG